MLVKVFVILFQESKFLAQVKEADEKIAIATTAIKLLATMVA